jgi:outer membrane protein assembly factor BamD (BamD/ComL family)
LKGRNQPDDALVLFERVRKMEGSKTGEAALAKAALLFKQEQYDELVDNAEELRKNLNEEERYLLDVYIGRSYLALNRYESAIELLSPLRNMKSENVEAKKAVYLTLIVSYEQLNMPKETIETVDIFKVKYPQDDSLPKVLYLEALSLKSLEQYEQALALMDRLITEYPVDENRESLDFERAFVLFKMGRWQESRDGFVQYLKKYPSTLLDYSALSYAAHASVKLSEQQNPPSLQTTQQLVIDLEKLLQHPSISSNTQKPKYLLLLAKANVDLKQYQEGKATAQIYVNEYPRDEDLFQGYLLLATCCKEGDQDLVGFTDNGEHILRIKPDYQDGQVLRLNLFGAYLELAKAASEINDKESELYLDLAADHLFHVLGHDSALVKNENKIWLANHYYAKAADGSNDYFIDLLWDPEKLELAHKSLQSYELALIRNEKLNKENIHLESEYLKWSHLYGWTGDSKKQISVLEGLVEQQKSQCELSWKLRSRSQFALARAYQATGQTDRALAIFQALRTQSKNGDLTVVSGAQLEWARLNLSLIPAEKRTADNPQVESVLKSLKELQAKKSLPQEPIHLEAALEYASLKSALETSGKQLDQHKELLVKMKENFTSREDLWSKDYYAARQMHPDKDFIYQAYMMLLDAHLVQFESKIAAREGRKVEAEVKAETAKAIYKSLIKGKLAVSKYIVDQSKAALRELD